MIKAVLFDLDGTMLPLDMKKFIKIYFSELSKKFCPDLGVDAETFAKSIWVGIKAMSVSDGKASCKDRFWGKFEKMYGKNALKLEEKFDKFYDEEFLKVKEATWKNPTVLECIELLQNKNIEIIAATNPIFPLVATKNRIKWAGLNTNMFKHITTYDNSSFCKPDLRYYKEILQKNNLKPEECLMVGNDVDEDMCAEELGMDTFLVTDCLIARDKDYSMYKQGSFEDLKEYLEKL